MSMVDIKKLTARVDALERTVGAMDARLTAFDEYLVARVDAIDQRYASFEEFQTTCVDAIDQRCVGVRASLHADMRALCDVLKAELREVLKDDVSRSLQPVIREAVRSHTLTTSVAPS